MPAKSAVIIVPSQGLDTKQFRDNAQALKATVYPSPATQIVTSEVGELGDHNKLQVELLTESGTRFVFAPTGTLDAVLTLSHSGQDGPNVAYGGAWGSRQPWQLPGNDDRWMTDARLFWPQVARAMKPSGKIILLGCQQGMDSTGRGAYASFVASYSQRVVYASKGYHLRAADLSTVLRNVRAIEAGGRPPELAAFSPRGP